MPFVLELISTIATVAVYHATVTPYVKSQTTSSVLAKTEATLDRLLSYLETYGSLMEREALHHLSLREQQINLGGKLESSSLMDLRDQFRMYKEFTRLDKEAANTLCYAKEVDMCFWQTFKTI
jgi:hypothetical protein